MAGVRHTAEWLEADGLGGFASGTADGIRTRRYHALLLAATTPPTGRCVLVNGLEAWLETPRGDLPLSSQLYAADAAAGGAIEHPRGFECIESFEFEPWPRWRFALAGDIRVEQELFARHGLPVVCISWRLAGLVPHGESRILCVRPLLSGRDSHSLQHANRDFNFVPEIDGERITWSPYDGVPRIAALTNATYAHDPTWYRNFLYAAERERGLDCQEDLAAPGVLRFDLARGEAVLILAAETPETAALLGRESAAVAADLRARERQRRAAFATPVERAADAYLVRRGAGRTLVAGYPWFTDWGRDTFIALRGICLATGRLGAARDILLEWAGAMSQGMLPNRFPERGGGPEYNSVDASLWYIIAVHDYCAALAARGSNQTASEMQRFRTSVEDILTGYANGSRFGIGVDADGLLRAGEPGVQLTWMDAKVGDWVVTPRIGKPVEIQALWLNALWYGSTFGDRWRRLYAAGLESFQTRFWNAAGGCLFDVVDVDHVPGKLDASCRPNQIFAVGGLPIALLDLERARRVVDAVESRLWTPLGLRTLGPGEPGYTAHYVGDARSRDAAYHQGTAWPWLLGAFVDGWIGVRAGSAAARREAAERFLAPLLAHLDEAGLGHVSEIADAEPPHTPRGCPFQAWSMGELLRICVAVGSQRNPVPPPAKRFTAHIAPQ